MSIFADELRLAIGMPVRLCVAAPESIEAAIVRIYQDAAALIEEVVTDAAESEDQASVLDLQHETPAVVFINRVIAKALDLGASDIHFTPQQRRLYVRIRVDGVLRELSSIAGTQAGVVAARLKIMGGLDIAERRMPQDGRVAIREAMTVPRRQDRCPSVGLRREDNAADSFAGRGTVVARRSRDVPAKPCRPRLAISQPFGAVVAVGPTGSGKTTTLFACMQMLNSPDRQLTTIEDPVEYRTEGLDQIEVNASAGLTFATGLRTILRSDPDVLLIGEVRDEETAQIAFRAAMTGHLVLTTLHAQTAAVGDPAAQRHEHRAEHPCHLDQLHRRATSRTAGLSRVLSARRSRVTSLLESLLIPSLRLDPRSSKRQGVPRADDTGYNGRTPIFEVMTMTDELAELIEARRERSSNLPCPRG